MKLLAAWRRKRVARRYARVLPRWLVRSYGASDRYPVQQIEAALAALGLPSDFAAFAYAAFLSEEDYEGNRQRFLPYLPYNVARRAFLDALPRGLTSASASPSDSLGAGTDGAGHGSGHDGAGHG
jgi:hypothetical protein